MDSERTIRDFVDLWPGTRKSLAAAMGKPVLMMLKFGSGLLWLLDREDSPWYPTARLFRQMERGDWPWVVNGVRDALEAYLRIISS